MSLAEGRTIPDLATVKSMSGTIRIDYQSPAGYFKVSLASNTPDTGVYQVTDIQKLNVEATYWFKDFISIKTGDVLSTPFFESLWNAYLSCPQSFTPTGWFDSLDVEVDGDNQQRLFIESLHATGYDFPDGTTPAPEIIDHAFRRYIMGDFGNIPHGTSIDLSDYKIGS